MAISLVRAELVLAYGQTDRHDDANSSFPQFCEAAEKQCLCKDVERITHHFGVQPS
jgi:hypothetical protein